MGNEGAVAVIEVVFVINVAVAKEGCEEGLAGVEGYGVGLKVVACYSEEVEGRSGNEALGPCCWCSKTGGEILRR